MQKKPLIFNLETTLMHLDGGIYMYVHRIEPRRVLSANCSSHLGAP